MHSILRWQYSDGSGNGVVTRVFTEEERLVIQSVLDAIPFQEITEWIPVEMPGSHPSTQKEPLTDDSIRVLGL